MHIQSFYLHPPGRGRSVSAATTKQWGQRASAWRNCLRQEMLVACGKGGKQIQAVDIGRLRLGMQSACFGMTQAGGHRMLFQHRNEIFLSQNQPFWERKILWPVVGCFGDASGQLVYLCNSSTCATCKIMLRWNQNSSWHYENNLSACKGNCKDLSLDANYHELKSYMQLALEM